MSHLCQYSLYKNNGCLQHSSYILNMKRYCKRHYTQLQCQDTSTMQHRTWHTHLQQEHKRLNVELTLQNQYILETEDLSDMIQIQKQRLRIIQQLQDNTFCIYCGQDMYQLLLLKPVPAEIVKLILQYLYSTEQVIECITHRQ